MKYYGKKNIPERLSHAEEMIKSVSVDEALGRRLATVGYTDVQFTRVHNLLAVAQRLETNQRVQVGKQTAATHRLIARTQSMRLKFVGDRKIVRHVLKGNPSLSDELRLHIKTQKGREALIRQMTHFYESVVAHEVLMGELAREYNLTAALFAVRLQDVSVLAAAMQAQRYQIGQVRVATRDRQEAMEQLDRWMAAFIGMARQVFRGEEENLRKLRIYSRRRSRSISISGDSEVGE